MRNASVAPPIRSTVASTVRAELARAGVNQTTAAQWIGVTQPAMSARLHARVPITVDELDAIARGLDLPIEALLATNVLPFPRSLGDDAGRGRATLDESARSSTDRASDYGSLVRFPHRRPVLTLVRGRAS